MLHVHTRTCIRISPDPPPDFWLHASSKVKRTLEAEGLGTRLHATRTHTYMYTYIPTFGPRFSCQLQHEVKRLQFVKLSS